MVNMESEYDPDELATKITTQLVQKGDSKNLCVAIFVGQIAFNMNTTPAEIRLRSLGFRVLGSGCGVGGWVLGF